MFWFMGIINAGRQYSTLLIRQNLVLKGIMKIVNTFLDDGIKKKFRFLRIVDLKTKICIFKNEFSITEIIGRIKSK
jgi:hypothetical protein